MYVHIDYVYLFYDFDTWLSLAIPLLFMVHGQYCNEVYMVGTESTVFH